MVTVVDPVLATGNSAIAPVRRLKTRGDQKLDEHGYIVPGLGDAGDRPFSTK